MRFFSRDEMLRVINSADLYVHPAEIEIEAIACLEAISCGLVPVIADSPRSATRFFALGERNLFHFNDPADLAATAARFDGLLEDYLTEYRRAGLEPVRYGDIDAFLRRYLDEE